MPAATRGYDVGKKVPGRKRHVVTDSLGLLLPSQSPPRTWATARPRRASPGTGEGRASLAPSHLGGRRLHRRARRLGQGGTPPHPGDRQAQ
ncbi:hypothetical protein [Streptomyces rubiginosohelvolus]|uniref:hypothetical protein n=1 Tax=Streptomyces rubiginosohelvolus TaxID=67362 RepID=UPI0036A114C9